MLRNLRCAECPRLYRRLARRDRWLLLLPLSGRYRERAEKIAGERIVTYYWAKPIPPRNFDWTATRDNDEPDDDGHMMQGWGRTEQDAIDDLIAQIKDAAS